MTFLSHMQTLEHFSEAAVLDGGCLIYMPGPLLTVSLRKISLSRVRSVEIEILLKQTKNVSQLYHPWLSKIPARVGGPGSDITEKRPLHKQRTEKTC